MNTDVDDMSLLAGRDKDNNRQFPNLRHFETLEQVRNELHRLGVEAYELIVGVSFAQSNRWSGKKTFNGKCLHDACGESNPYLQALTFITKRLNIYDDDHLVPCYGFGDATTGKDAVFSFFPGNERANGLGALLERYKEIAPSVDMSGPTSFAPLIRQAMRDVYNSGMKFHTLLILTDGQASDACLEETKTAIVEACAFPMSIVLVGVGDGPWTEMNRFDNELPERPWDNVHFFELERIINGSAFASKKRQEDDFEFNVLAELPEQHVYVSTLTGQDKQAGVGSIIDAIPSTTLIDPPSVLDMALH